MVGCAKESTIEIDPLPEEIKSIENLHVFQSDIKAKYKIGFTEVGVFETNEEVLLEGFIRKVEIDNKDRVYITASNMGSAAVYVFSPEGKFITKIGRHGRGPGEFESISSLSISETKLYVFGQRQQKISVFLLNNFNHLYDQFIDRSLVKNDDEFSRLMKANSLYAIEDGDLLVQFEVYQLYNMNKHPQIRFYKVSNEGQIISEKVIEVERYRFFFWMNLNQVQTALDIHFLHLLLEAHYLQYRIVA